MTNYPVIPFENECMQLEIRTNMKCWNKSGTQNGTH